MAQYLRPDSTLDAGSWTGGYDRIDETSPDDGDYISTTTSGSYAKFSLSDVDAPGSGNCVMRIRAKAAVNTPSRTLNWILVQGSTAKVTRSNVLTNAYQTFSYTLTSGEAESITDWDDLRIWVDVTGTGTNAGYVSWFEIEIPDAVRNAVLSKTLDGIGGTRTVAVAVAAAATATLGSIGLAAGATVAVHAVADQALDGLGLVATAEAPSGGRGAVLDQALEGLGLAATAEALLTEAVLDLALSDVAVSAGATVAVAAVTDQALGDLAAEAAAAVAVAAVTGLALGDAELSAEFEAVADSFAEAAITLADATCEAATETTISAVLEQTLDDLALEAQVFNPNENLIESGYRCWVAAAGDTTLSELPCNVYSVVVSTLQTAAQTMVLHDSLDPTGDPNPVLTLAFKSEKPVLFEFAEQIEFNVGLSVASSHADNRGYIQFGYA